MNAYNIAFKKAYGKISTSQESASNADFKAFMKGIEYGYYVSFLALIPVLTGAIKTLIPGGSMTSKVKVVGVNGYQYNATVEIAGSTGGVSVGDIGAGLIIQQVTGSGSEKIVRGILVLKRHQHQMN